MNVDCYIGEVRMFGDPKTSARAHAHRRRRTRSIRNQPKGNMVRILQDANKAIINLADTRLLAARVAATPARRARSAAF